MGAYVLFVWTLGITGILAYWASRLTWFLAKKIYWSIPHGKK